MERAKPDERLSRSMAGEMGMRPSRRDMAVTAVMLFPVVRIEAARIMGSVLEKALLWSPVVGPGAAERSRARGADMAVRELRVEGGMLMLW